MLINYINALSQPKDGVSLNKFSFLGAGALCPCRAQRVNNNHFNLLYSKNYNIDNVCFKYIDEKLKYEYVDCSFYNSKNIYNEIYNYLQSIYLNKNLIENKIKKYPKMSYNQTLFF